jgi:hypothetical protein
VIRHGYIRVKDETKITFSRSQVTQKC